jgi:hypothetical protein
MNGNTLSGSGGTALPFKKYGIDKVPSLDEEVAPEFIQASLEVAIVLVAQRRPLKA